MHTRRIMKFGGSSLADGDCWRKAKKIIKDRLDLNPVIVVSAMGAVNGGPKVTDMLQEAGALLLEGRDASGLVREVIDRHRAVAAGLEIESSSLEADFQALKKAAEALPKKKFSSREEALDSIMGFGEIFSARLMQAFLQKDGLRCLAALPGESGFITDDRFQDADVLEESLENIASYVIASREIPIFPGFVGITRDGRPTTLGRGGSDYTAAVLGAALKRQVEIWTDVDGIYRINPGYLSHHFIDAGHPQTIPHLSYDEAFQMASFGSRVLHQKALLAVQQAVRKGKHIHLFIKNTFNPDHPGTVISSQKQHQGIPRGITCLPGTQLYTIYARSPQESARFAQRLKELPGLAVALSSNTWGRISFVFDRYHPVLSQLESEFNSHLSRDQVLVKIVGDGIGENPETLSRINGALHSAESPEEFGMTLVHKSPQLLTDNTFEFLVKKRGLAKILQTLYKDLFMRDVVTIGMLGLGTVGGGVIQYSREMYSPEKSGFRLDYPTALVRDMEKKRPVPFDGTLTARVEDILENPLVDVVLEVMGGIEPARTYILKALEAGKHVVTANKALLSHRGREIFEKAHRHRRNVGFEASVCGEIPIVDDFLKFPGLGDIDGLEGIVNGTSNYVLTRFMEGMPIGEALRIAQEKGFAEADPYMDVSGIDAAQKLCILASILFNQPVDFEMIPRQGIDGLTPADADAFRRWGFTVKPIVAARVKQDRLVLYSCPALLPQGHPLASVREENNALSLYLKGRVEPITKIGKGAGAIPTARSIVRDILDVARKARAYMVEVPGYFRAKGGMEMSRVEEIESAWYVRLTVKDNPGVFGKIASILGDFDLSILRVHQEINRDADEAHVLLELKDSPRKRLDMALDLITRFPFVKSCLPCMILQC